ncbi:MAG: hypothetical protein HUK22_05335, partial [Thermoguttaceae bacterium]|nr:hypothetical protein [Thermoguttaceae bacterium]
PGEGESSVDVAPEVEPENPPQKDDSQAGSSSETLQNGDATKILSQSNIPPGLDSTKVPLSDDGVKPQKQSQDGDSTIYQLQNDSSSTNFPSEDDVDEQHTLSYDIEKSLGGNEGGYQQNVDFLPKWVRNAFEDGTLKAIGIAFGLVMVVGFSIFLYRLIDGLINNWDTKTIFDFSFLKWSLASVLIFILVLCVLGIVGLMCYDYLKKQGDGINERNRN